MKRKTVRKSTTPRKHYGYCRVSTNEQAEGISLEAQAARIKAYAAATGRVLEHVYIDELSGKNMSRPSLADLLAKVNLGEVESIFVVKIDRLTRSIQDLVSIVQVLTTHGTSLVSTTESIDTGSASGRMILHLLGILAQFEREQISERTTMSLTHLRKNGRVYGHTPFGFRRDVNELIRDPEQIAILRELHRQRSEGATFRYLAEWLQAQGVRPNQGGSKWYPSAVRDILSGPTLKTLLETS